MLERNEDLFEETRMSFGEHIEELRRCLVKALYGVAVAAIIGFIFADEIVTYLQKPLADAIREFDQEEAKKELEQRYGFFDPEFDYWVKSQGMAPRTVRVSPDQFRTISGEPVENTSSDEISLGFECKPKKVGVIANRLTGTESRTNKQIKNHAAAIFRQLTDDEKKEFQNLAKRSEFSEQDAERVQEVFNRVASETKLYEEKAFEDITLEQKGWLSFFSDATKNPYPAIRKRIEEKSDSILGAKLNRALIRRTFENELSPPRANLIEIEIWESVNVETQSLTPHEAFMIWMKAALFAALILSSPWIFYQLWLFISAGLYPHEKRYVHWYLPISILLFFAGVSLAFFFVMEPVLNFLFAFNQSMGITPQLRINYWLSFVMYLPVGFGIAFQLPLVMLLLNRLGIFEVKAYLSKWRVAIMIIFVASMLLTPADPMSMIMLAVPLTILYFLGIGLCKWMPRNRNPFGEVYEPA